MSEIQGTPTNLNFLSPLNFKFVLKRAPNIDFFLQKASVPSVILPAAGAPTPVIRIPYPGDHIEYEDLEITFKIDEELINYGEVYNWMISLGRLFPGNYANLQSQPTFTGESIKSDVGLIVLNSHRIPIYEIIFHEAWPTSLSGFEFDTTMDDVNFITATARFKYAYYDIKQIM